MNLRRKILLGLSLVLIITATSTTSIATILANKFMKEDIEKELSLYYKSSVQEINSFFNKKIQILNTAHDMIIKNNKNPENLKVPDLYIYNVDKEITSLYVIYNNGKVIDSSGWVPDPDDDLTKRDYHIGAIAKDGIYISDAYMDADTKSFITTVARPFRTDAGKLMGSISVDMKLDTLNERLSKTSVSLEKSSFVMFDKNGIILSHPNTGLLGKSYKENPDTNILYNEISKNQGFNGIKLSNGENRIYSGKVDGLGWNIAIFVNDSVAFSRLNAMKLTSVVNTLIIVIGILILVSVLINKTLIRKILKISNGLDSYSNFDFTKFESSVTNFSGDELSNMEYAMLILKNTFSQMAERLQDSSISLVNASDQLKSISDNVTERAKAISVTMNDLAKGAVSQAEDTENGLNSVVEMKSLIDANYSFAQNVYDSSLSMQDTFSLSSEALKSLSSSMQETFASFANVAETVEKTQESSEEINEASMQIADIANKTNLLALNAAIDIAVVM